MIPTSAPTVADQIIQVVNALCQKLGIAFDWSAANILPQLQTLGRRIVVYRLALSILWLAIGIAMLVSAIFMIKAIIGIAKKDREKTSTEEDKVDDFKSVAYTVVSIFFVIIGAIIFIDNVTNIITCFTFPEKIIYDYIMPIIQSLTKK